MPEWSVPGYTELKRLGSGGFGEVVLARHHASGVLVAIKYLRQDLLADQGFAEMFRDEAQTLASLDDPNVVRLYEYVESPSGAAIVMELVEGVSLREILTHQGSAKPESALVVLQGSLLGLAAAHRQGVVHRDYKPENVLVNGDGASKLTDFGLAARAGGHPIPAGTLRYAAPEQIDGRAASPASDVYAATATFYECLTGHPPFSGEPEALLRQHRSDPVPMEPVPTALRQMVAAGMAKNPQDRPADAASFVTELRTVAVRAYGKDWASRGRSHLGEAALLLLAALWRAVPVRRPRCRVRPWNGSGCAGSSGSGTSARSRRSSRSASGQPSSRRAPPLPPSCRNGTAAEATRRWRFTRSWSGPRPLRRCSPPHRRRRGPQHPRPHRRLLTTAQEPAAAAEAEATEATAAVVVAEAEAAVVAEEEEGAEGEAAGHLQPPCASRTGRGAPLAARIPIRTL